jgi:predicted RNase H-like HicB family nuclease
VFKACHSYGTTIDEALLNIKEVIDMCIEEEKEKASEIQPPYSFLALHRNLSGQQ